MSGTLGSCERGEFKSEALPADRSGGLGGMLGRSGLRNPVKQSFNVKLRGAPLLARPSRTPCEVPNLSKRSNGNAYIAHERPGLGVTLGICRVVLEAGSGIKLKSAGGQPFPE